MARTMEDVPGLVVDPSTWNGDRLQAVSIQGVRSTCRDKSFHQERGVATENFYLGLAFQVDAKDKYRARLCASGGRGIVIALLGDGEMASLRKRMCL